MIEKPKTETIFSVQDAISEIEKSEEIDFVNRTDSERKYLREAELQLYEKYLDSVLEKIGIEEDD